MPSFIPTDEQWEKMKKHIKGERFKKEDFFVFETLAVGDKIVPNRNIKLTPDLLEIMKEDAQKGVSLMLNHNWSQLGVQSIPIGKVFDGRISSSSQEGETTTLYTTQYILRDDSKVDGYSKNDIIKLIESGILTDTSVGWGTTSESYKCSICGNSIYDYRHCEHIPGKKYIVNEETNEVKKCIVEAHPPKEKHSGNNVLMENSVVFDGAYPNAIIQSSIGEKMDNTNGKYKTIEGKINLSNEDIIIGYSTNGGINLLYKELKEKGGADKMENEIEDAVEKLQNEEIENQNVEETMNTEEVIESQKNTEETLYTTEDILNKFGNISDSVETLIELAKEGLEIRNEIILNALESGIHAMGNKFNKEIFEKTFSNMKTKDIKEMAEAWEKQADNIFRKSKVSIQTETKKENKTNVDLKMFKTDNY